MRVPRKLKKQIPEGPYCYKGLKFVGNVYHIKPCFFYQWIKRNQKPIKRQKKVDLESPEEFVPWCTLLHCHIDDQVKECQIKDPF